MISLLYGVLFETASGQRLIHFFVIEVAFGFCYFPFHFTDCIAFIIFFGLLASCLFFSSTGSHYVALADLEFTM